MSVQETKNNDDPRLKVEADDSATFLANDVWLNKRAAVAFKGLGVPLRFNSHASLSSSPSEIQMRKGRKFILYKNEVVQRNSTFDDKDVQK